MLVLEKLGTAPAQPLTEAGFAALPRPKNVWDNEMKWE